MTDDPEILQPLLNCLGCLAVPIVIALMIAFAIAGARAERRRTSAIAGLAAQLGFQFTARDGTVVQQLAGFGGFGQGHSREGRNICRGTRIFGGVRASVLLGDYRYKVTRGSGKNRSTTTYDLSFIAVLPVLAIPEDISVRPERMLDRIGAFVGFDDIDFESSEFSKRFHVKCSDRRFAYDLFDPRMIEYFLGEPPPNLEAHRGIIVIDDGFVRFGVAGFHERLAWLDGFFARIPRHVRAERLPPAERASDPILNPTGQHGDGADA